MDTYIDQEILELKEELRQNKKLESLKKIKEEELFNKKSLKQDLKDLLYMILKTLFILMSYY